MRDATAVERIRARCRPETFASRDEAIRYFFARVRDTRINTGYFIIRKTAPLNESCHA